MTSPKANYNVPQILLRNFADKDGITVTVHSRITVTVHSMRAMSLSWIARPSAASRLGRPYRRFRRHTASNR